MPPSVPRLLIADDQRDVREALRLLFKGEGWTTETVDSPREALRCLGLSDYDLLLMDLNYALDTTSGQEGLDLLRKIRGLDEALPVVVMTAWGSVDLAVRCMQQGAQDFVEKPWDNQRLLNIVRTQIDLAGARREARQWQAAQRLQTGPEAPLLIAQSAAMLPVLDAIARVGPSDACVLITGENGTGKGLVARALHAASPRARRPLVSVNMGGISESVFESELFGHVRGAFTDAKQDRLGRIEMAEGGALFFDEIANTPLTQQAKLLRLLETGEYERLGSSKTARANVRFLSATNAGLPAEVQAGRFRQDLLFRLNTVEIHLPALRDRTEDILPLAQFFLEQHRQRHASKLAGFDGDAIERLVKHAWPGNVRELSHVVERAVLMSGGPTIRAADLGLGAPRGAAPSLDEMSLEEVERHLIRRTLQRFNGNARQAADALGLSRSAFYRRLERHGF